MKQKKLTSNHFEWGPLTKSTYTNGCVFLHHRSTGLRGASLNIYFATGSRHEKVRESGICHLIEHLIFKNDLVKEIENHGGTINAYTSKEYTCFELSSLTRDIAHLFSLFIKMVLNPTFTPNDLRQEKGVVIQEIREDMDDFEIFASELLFKRSFSFPLGHPIGGTISSVKKITTKNVRNFYQKKFIPPKMVICLVANNQPDKYIKELTKLFCQLNLTTKSQIIRPNPRIKSKANNFNSTVIRDCTTATLIFSASGAAMFSKERSIFYLLDIYLTDGMSSKLFKSLRDQGLIYGMASIVSSFTDNGIFEIRLNCEQDKVTQIKKEINLTFKELALFGIEINQLNIIKQQLLNSIELNLDNLEERNSILGRSELFFGKAVSLSQLEKRIKAITSDDIKKVAKKIVRNKFSTTLIKSSGASI